MSFYDYPCEVCGNYQTLLLKVPEATPRRECTECHSPQGFVKQVSAPSFQLKGSGWYQTDFKNN